MKFTELLTEASVLLIEKGGEQGRVWDVVLIDVGLSLNNKFYPKEVLSGAKDLFEGSQCFAYEFKAGAHDKNYNHLPWRVRQVMPDGLARNLVGDFRNVRFGEYTSPEGDKRHGLLAEFHCIEDWLRQKLVNAYNSGNPSMLGFSIDAEGIVTDYPHKGRIVKKVVSIEKVHEVTAVTSPAAGGKILRLVASIEGAEVMEELKKKLKELFSKNFLEGKLLEGIGELTEEKMVELVDKAVEKAEEDKELVEQSKLPIILRALRDALKGGDTKKAMTMVDDLISNLAKYPYPAPAKAADMMDKKKKYPYPSPVKAGEGNDDNKGKVDPEAVKKMQEQLKKLEEEEAEKARVADIKKLISEAKLSNAQKAELETACEKVSVEETKKLVEKALKGKDLAEDETVKGLKESVAKLQEDAKKDRDELQKIRKEEQKAKVKLLITESKLPKPFQEKLAEQLAESNVEVATKLIESERKALAAIEQSVGSGIAVARAELQESERDKFQLSMDAMLGVPVEGNVAPFRGIQHAFAVITGRRDFEVRDVLAEAVMFVPSYMKEGQGRSRVLESLKTSDFAEILGDSIHRRMVREYKLDDLNTWRQLVSEISNIKDFRVNPRMRMGGYGTLPEVPEQGTYQPLTSPTDEQATFQIKKRGGLEDLTMEMIANDDIGALKKIPIKLGRAAVLTLYRTIFDILRLNPTIYDTKTLFHADHANTDTKVLSSDNLMLVRKAMQKQQPYGQSDEFLGMMNVPARLVIPPDLEDVAFQLLKSAVEVISNKDATVPNIHSTYLKGYIVVPYWTDATDWVAVADPAMINTIEVGFYQGKQDPELFVQDQPNVGSVFTADKITYKIRHIWGFAVLDYRGFYKNVAAG